MASSSVVCPSCGAAWYIVASCWICGFKKALVENKPRAVESEKD